MVFLFLILGLAGLWLLMGSEMLVFQDGDSSMIKGLFFSNWIVNKLLFLAGLAAVLWQVIRLNNIHKLVEGNSLPVVVFCLLGSMCFSFSEIHLSALLSILFSIFGLSFLLRIHNQNSVLGLLFTSAFFIGIASLFLLQSAIQLIVVLITILSFRPYESRNYIMMLIGFGIPLFYFFSIHYLFDIPFPSLKFYFSSPSFLMEEQAKRVIPIVFLTLIGFVSMSRLFASRTKFIVRQRNQLLIMACFVLSQMLMGIFIPETHAIIAILPLGGIAFMHLYKNASKKWMWDTALFLLLVSIIVVKTLG